MKYLIAATDNKYIEWQALVQIHNFKKYGLDKDLIYLIGYETKPSESMLKIAKHTGVRFYFYKDMRNARHYLPSICPHLIYQYLRSDYELIKQSSLRPINDRFMYLDPDVIFLKKPNFNQFLDNDTWYMSDTSSYLDTNYINSKGDDILDKMCEIVGIDKKLVEKNDKNAGGAQIIMKNPTDPRFWKKVEEDSVKLYDYMVTTAKKGEKYPIQSWTAEMWAILWNIWLSGNKTKIIKKMEFSWATDHKDRIDGKTIFHNAGVFDQKHLFNKTKYTNKYPFFDDFSFVDEKYGSHTYVQEIMEAKKTYPKELISG
jgi:hypothetical protein